MTSKGSAKDLIIFDILDNGGRALIKITNMMLDGTVTNVGTVLSAIEKNKVFMLFNLGKDSHAYTFKNNWSRFDKLLAKIEKGHPLVGLDNALKVAMTLGLQLSIHVKGEL